MVIYCTRKQIRTATPFQAPPPQDGASTNFATRVYAANIELCTTLQNLTCPGFYTCSLNKYQCLTYFTELYIIL